MFILNLSSVFKSSQELIDWNKAILPQVGKLGPDYLSWVHSPVDRPLRLFESDFVEFFSTTPWYVVPIIWIPTMLYFCYLSVEDLAARSGIENFNPYFLDSKPKVLFAFSLLFGCGVLVWSLIEYCLHRFLFHLINHVPADDPFWITIHFFLHGQHHKVWGLKLFYFLILYFNVKDAIYFKLSHAYSVHVVDQ